ncbi:MAG: hypothetical protein A3D67_01930 [Candidatus Lloydbacteria bacterium RIFCSPHIGHO2_02_FULL_51_22]|uniref:Uncharacterized protein n=3 Tax=Candidatus Lloydiibacteriota TaxID=1817910 RepID=A0A1G2DAF0_9BACT|nr:MAG: hypothetical protein A3D67_01930 [Candidatus Lloydbacteria bacterium RIFCSPHIGHO2_02_FULL_51_22]OGZ15575.1 MAG: hypothetical protein A3J08_01280 [Candidatus Lloydbacteria bacterium RIFCSPLOWO2_02_FULL_51_11]OGZ16314.1 MAG: hypothetical protein A3G11_00260 [Candidatus Lloydbacteria bacterium RIFCSPLOWO2_12_FULL_51_9]
MSTPVKYFAIAGLILAGGLLLWNAFRGEQGTLTGSLLVSEKTLSLGDSPDVTALLLVLRSLQNLSLDTSILDDVAFRALKDYSVILDAVPQGRKNPFAPI